MKNWKAIFIWVLIALIGIGISFSGVQFPPWAYSVAGGAVGAWIVLTFWQDGNEQPVKPNCDKTVWCTSYSKGEPDSGVKLT